MKILLIEDELLIADQLVSQLNELGYHSITVAADSDKAISAFKKDEHDLLIVDIGLIDSALDGVDTSLRLQEIKSTPCIFLSGFSDQKTLDRVKSVPHSNFLVKPCSSRQLYVSIDRAIDEFSKMLGHEQIPKCYFSQQEEHFYIKGKNNAYERVAVTDVHWIETIRGGIEINLTSGRSYILTASLNSFLLQFQHSSLIRVHRSFLINKKNVSAIKDRSFILNGVAPKKIIPCSQSYWNEIKDQFKTLRSD